MGFNIWSPGAFSRPLHHMWSHSLKPCIAPVDHTLSSCKSQSTKIRGHTLQEIHEIEERKNSHINELMKKHERAFAGERVRV